MNSNTQKWIAKAIQIHYDKYDYSHVEYKSNTENLEIICRW